jgi:hypothetical protein
MIDFAEFKKFFIYNMILALVVSAVVAVVSVLVGDFTETAARVLWTLLIVMLHSLVALCFIWDDERKGTFDRLSFFINVVFILIVVSFFTSIFGIWDIFSSGTVWETYRTFFVFGFAALHADILSKALNKENYIDGVVYANYLFMLIVVVMLMPIIYMENAFTELGAFFFRLLGAMAIIDGTLSMLTIIFYKLFMHKHPKVEDPLESGWSDGKPAKTRRQGMSIWVWLLLIYLFFQIVLPFFFLGTRLFSLGL